jgi:hypothetical protein
LNSYKIKLTNKKQKNKKTILAEVLSFPEAASIAYQTRSQLGYEWEIVSIKKQND